MNTNLKQKRMMKEIEHLNKNPSEDYTAGPLNNDLYQWHFTLRGPTDTEFEDGIYHGKIIFPFNFPLEPPDLYFLNKSGRFEVDQKICLTITGFHADQWNSSWTVRTILEALVSMFPEKEQVQSVGSVLNSVENRKKLAKESWNFVCEKCGPLNKILKQREKKEAQPAVPKAQVISQPQQQKEQEKQQEESTIQFNVEKEQQNLEKLQQRLKQLQSDQSKNKKDLFDRQTSNQREQQSFNNGETQEQDRLYNFNNVLKNLEETMNVINSIKMINNNNKTEEENQNQKDQKKDEQGKDISKDNKKEDQPSSSNSENKEKDMKEGQQDKQPEVDAQKESRQADINLNSDINKSTDNLSENKQNNKEELENAEEEESKENINLKDQENKDKKDINLGDDDEFVDEEDEGEVKGKEETNEEPKDTKQEAMNKIKKLDMMIYITIVLFAFYLTFLFQMSI